MKVFCLIGSAPNHLALVNKLSDKIDIAGVIVEKRTSRRRSLRKRLSLIFTRVLTYPLSNAWHCMISEVGDKTLTAEGAKVIDCKNINSSKVLKVISKERPDIVVVSGTRLLKSPLINEVSAFGRILNLHTGVSPYVNGGPNCTNWCLRNGEYDKIGSTVMWLDAGIDTGNIIVTDRPMLTGSESLAELHVKVMLHAHDIYIAAIEKLLATGKHNSIKQSLIGQGRTYYTSEWTIVEALKALIKFKLFYSQKRVRSELKDSTIKLIN